MPFQAHQFISQRAAKGLSPTGYNESLAGLPDLAEVKIDGYHVTDICYSDIWNTCGGSAHVPE
jgi:hypothetical protein